jgi:hypothetical protein
LRSSSIFPKELGVCHILSHEKECVLIRLGGGQVLNRRKSDCSHFLATNL